VADSQRIVLSAMNLQAFEPRISVFLVNSRDRVRELIGRRTSATAYLKSNALCVVLVLTRSAGLRHEMAHKVAMSTSAFQSDG
jgi:hypothetical protein